MSYEMSATYASTGNDSTSPPVFGMLVGSGNFRNIADRNRPPLKDLSPPAIWVPSAVINVSGFLAGCNSSSYSHPRRTRLASAPVSIKALARRLVPLITTTVRTISWRSRFRTLISLDHLLMLMVRESCTRPSTGSPPTGVSAGAPLHFLLLLSMAN